MLQNDKTKVSFVDAHFLRTWLDKELSKIYSGKIPIPVPIEAIIENIQKLSLDFEEYDDNLLGCNSLRVLDFLNILNLPNFFKS